MKKIIISIQVVNIETENRTPQTFFDKFKTDEEQFYCDRFNAEKALKLIEGSLTELANNFIGILNGPIGVDLWRFKKSQIVTYKGVYYSSVIIDINSYHKFDENGSIEFILPIKKVDTLGFESYFTQLDEYDQNSVKVRFKHYGRYVNKETEIPFNNLTEFNENIDTIHNNLKELYIKNFKRLK